MSKVPLIILSAILICLCIFPATAHDPIASFDAISVAINSFTSPFMGAVSDIFKPPVIFSEQQLADNYCFDVHVFTDYNNGYWQFKRIDQTTMNPVSNLRITFDGKLSSGNVPFLDFVGAGLLSVSPTFPNEYFGVLDSFEFINDYRYLTITFVRGSSISGSLNLNTFSIEIDRSSYVDFKLLINKIDYSVTVLGV